MIKFRWHRGTLEDSLATMIEFKGLTELQTYIRKELKFMRRVIDLKITHYGYDERCKQQLWAVNNGLGITGFICEDVE